MREQLGEELRYCQETPQANGKATVIFAHDAGLLLGWGLFVPVSWDRPVVHVYVRKSGRRQGVGTQIVKKALRVCQNSKLKKPIVYANGKVAHSFYNNFGKTVIQRQKLVIDLFV